ncbi:MULTISPECIES: YcdB/YcdC domain-containing protein [unclassified Lysinibacillus]|uniref:YcdB/YcdC domain-containing protein n=1 Tax=unclassified Lysinibacillus TaxID=2636778 RepID=UPI0037FDB77E
MGKFKKLGIILTSTAFSVGVLSPMAQASANVKDSPERIEIQVASTETKVTKSTLIKKLRELFPEKFNFLTDNDFYTGRGHYYNDDKTIRYDLSFQKTVNGKDVYGSITFMGDDLELESFYYQPANVADALYPAKYSKEDAQKIAQDFLKKFPNTANYKLQENDFDYGFNYTRPLSEPISYAFSYAPTHNGVTLSNHAISIGVLANGEVVNVYRNSNVSKKATFDGLEQKKSEADVLAQVRDNFAVELRYYLDYNYPSDKREVKLVYMPTSSFYGVHALTGQWQTANGFVAQAPSVKGVEKLSSEQLNPRKPGMTVEEVEEFAKSFLKVDPDKAKLQIDMVDERENENGETLYSVNYMYMYENGGSGASFEINKATGEITQYYDISRDFMLTDKKAEKITKDAALAKAIDYLKEWAPSYIHNYAKPLDDYGYDNYSNQYGFSFPRVVNGIPVVGDEIYVSVGTDGSLRGLNINQQKIDNWPSVSKVVSADKAKETFSNALKLKLQYTKQDKEDSNHYDLVYAPSYEGSIYNQIDALTGKWVNSADDSNNKPQISHPTAAEELNYLLAQNVLEVKDPANFNADTAVTKGEALKIILKSLTYGYYGYGNEEESYQSFNNIDPKHPLYGIVEQAVRMGVLQPADEFAVDATLTRQELAEWFIRVLRLEGAAKHNDIYKLNFADASTIDPAYAGYVALASAMGLIDAQQNNFNATEKVSYADLAVSTLRLARAIHENNTGRNYFY